MKMAELSPPPESVFICMYLYRIAAYIYHSLNDALMACEKCKCSTGAGVTGKNQG